ncbi:MAG: exported protein of unknown function [Gemmatimonadetes bacterium]|nr:exported protein of unknown function [Gemmatimonadota bacterium]
MSILALIPLVITLAGAPAQPQPQLRVSVDSAQHQVVITVGPLHMPAATPYEHHIAAEPVRFAWPVSGWMRGFRVDLVDSTGRGLPREMLHHAGVTSLSRRELAYPVAERLFAAGRETEPVMLPGSLGVPIKADDAMLLYYALANSTPVAVDGAVLRLTIPWVAEDARGQRDVFPVYFDAHPVIGALSTFNLAPGRSITSAEFVVPVTGHLRNLGGHLHDFGIELRLEDAETNEVLVRLRADRAPDGTVRDVDRTRFFFKRNGLRLAANHRYRVAAVYENPRCSQVAGAMGLLVGVFVPENVSEWPVVDATDSSYQKDLAWLLEYGDPGADESHHPAVSDSVVSHAEHGPSRVVPATSCGAGR